MLRQMQSSPAVQHHANGSIKDSASEAKKRLQSMFPGVEAELNRYIDDGCALETSQYESVLGKALEVDEESIPAALRQKDLENDANS